MLGRWLRPSGPPTRCPVEELSGGGAAEVARHQRGFADGAGAGIVYRHAASRQPPCLPTRDYQEARTVVRSERPRGVRKRIRNAPRGATPDVVHDPLM
jgi:hypothetical protein